MSLSYDDTTPYDALPPPPALPALYERIGSTKVYLREDVTSLGKRKLIDRLEEDVPQSSVDVQMDESELLDSDPSQRQNALFIRGTPISHLPTDLIFAYTAQYDVKPMALEWLDDISCILVFQTRNEASLAFEALKKTKSSTTATHSDEMELDHEGNVLAHPLPQTLWPAVDRITSTLLASLPANTTPSSREEDVATIMKGPIRIRIARSSDVKQRNAKSQSQYYKKHGRPGEPRIPHHPLTEHHQQNGHGTHKRRKMDENDEERMRAALDAQLDSFLAEDVEGEQEGEQEEVEVAEPVQDLMQLVESSSGKMRADHLPSRSLLDRTAGGEMWQKSALEDRVHSKPLPRRRRGGGGSDRNTKRTKGHEPRDGVEGDWNQARMNTLRNVESGGERIPERRVSDRKPRHPTEGKGKKTMKDLDDELDDFLKDE